MKPLPRPGAVSLLPKPLLAAGLSVLVLLTGAAPAAADDAVTAKSRLERLANELRDVLGALRQRVAERDDLRSRLATADREIAQANAHLLNAERDAAALQSRLGELRVAQAQARASIDTQRDALARSLVLAARGGNSDRLKLLLNQQDPAALARQLRYQRCVTATQAERITTLRRQLEVLAAGEAQITADVATQAEQQTRLEQQQRQLAALRDERKALLAQADQDIDRGERRARAIEQDQRELQSLLANIAKQQAREHQRAAERTSKPKEAPRAEPPAPEQGSVGQMVHATPTPGPPGERFAAQRSHLPWPVSGDLKTRFGSPRESGRTHWEGVVIGARPGSPVRSIHAGTVVYADVLGGYGLLVIVDHGEGYMSLYGYNDAVLKRVGQRVQGGEPIASVGDRGGASGTYFEIRYRGQPVNPSAWCGG